MTTYPLRTKFNKEIIAEFFPPLTRKPPKRNRVIILCDGMPAVPSKGRLIEFFAKKGYWVFHPRYRGTWESGGEFLKKSPHLDILDLISGLPKGFKSLWDGKTFKVKPDKIFVIGSSFGGATAILSSENPGISGIIAISPVVDWNIKSKEEPLEWFGRIVKSAFGEGYRYSDKNWRKLGKNGFFNPASCVAKLDGKKMLLFHCKDDDVVGWRPVKKFADKIGCRLILRKRGGHLGLSSAMEPVFYKQIKKFLR